MQKWIQNWIWFKTIKNKLNSKYQIKMPAMPRPWLPKYVDWKKVLNQLQPDSDTTLVGHSLGGAFCVRYLQESGLKVKKLILIAPGYQKTKQKLELDNFYNFEIQTKSKIAKQIVLFNSSNDSEHIQISSQIYEQKLILKVINLTNRGHFFLKRVFRNWWSCLIIEICHGDEASDPN